jgi:histidine triad (HIT) family protein
MPRTRRAGAGECTFCRIARGEEAARVVFEDAVALAFLDHRPLLRGHLLLVPRAHHATLLDLPPRLVGPLFARARRLAAAVERGLGAEGSFVAINNRVSQSVPHLHVHVVPRRRGDGLRGFFWPRTRYADDADEKAVADAIRAVLEEDEADAAPEAGP